MHFGGALTGRGGGGGGERRWATVLVVELSHGLSIRFRCKKKVGV